MSSLRYNITIKDRENNREYSFDFEKIDTTHEMGVICNAPVGELTRGNQERFKLLAWSNCEKYEDYKSVTYLGDKE